MKKILFLQIKGNSLGGIWFVNKTLGEEFEKRGYQVKVLGIRDNAKNGIDTNKEKLDITTINEVDDWKIVRRRDVLNALKSKDGLKCLKQYFIDRNKLKDDYEKMKKFINEYNPDYIIASHYQTLPGIPEKFLTKTIHVQHSTIRQLYMDKKNCKVLKKYQNKIKLCWLCKSTKDLAEKMGFNHSNYIYNPCKFDNDTIADVVNNKKIIVITRIHPEKRIDLMVDVVNEIFKDEKYKDWKFEIYGIGSFNEKSQKILKSSTQIKYLGKLENVKAALLNSSFTLNTSLFEGFPLSIIEAYTCGLPAVSFDFGETSSEVVVDNYNGYLIKQNDIEKLKNAIKLLLDNPNKLLEFSINAKDYSKKFTLNNIINEWEKLFEELEKRK